MSDRVVPLRPGVPLRSWTDGAMGATRASRRRCVVAYALLLACLICPSVPGGRAIGDALVVAVAALGAVFFVLTVSTREHASDRPGLDERDEIARDQAFRRASACSWRHSGSPFLRRGSCRATAASSRS